jgi:hypothetical protein
MEQKPTLVNQRPRRSAALEAMNQIRQIDLNDIPTPNLKTCKVEDDQDNYLESDEE